MKLGDNLGERRDFGLGRKDNEDLWTDDNSRKAKRLYRKLDNIVDEGFVTGDNIQNDDITKGGDSLIKDKGKKGKTQRPTPRACKWVAARPRAKQIKQYQARATLSHRVDDPIEK